MNLFNDCRILSTNYTAILKRSSTSPTNVIRILRSIWMTSGLSQKHCRSASRNGRLLLAWRFAVLYTEWSWEEKWLTWRDKSWWIPDSVKTSEMFNIKRKLHQRSTYRWQTLSANRCHCWMVSCRQITTNITHAPIVLLIYSKTNWMVW